MQVLNFFKFKNKTTYRDIILMNLVTTYRIFQNILYQNKDNFRKEINNDNNESQLAQKLF